MERLTIRVDDFYDDLDEIRFINKQDEGGSYNLMDIVRYGTEEQLYNIANRLAAYEDTGLSPERCAELAKADQEGRLVELPCKVGDTIYTVDTDPELDYTGIEVTLVDNFVICDDGEILLKSDAYDGVICTAESIQKGTLYLDYYKAFLNQEEAEKALQEAEKALEENK